MYEHLMSLFSDVTENSTMIQAWLIRMMFKQLCQIQGGDLVNNCYLIYALNAKSPFQLILSRVVQWVTSIDCCFHVASSGEFSNLIKTFREEGCRKIKFLFQSWGLQRPGHIVPSAKIHHWFIITFCIVPKTETFTEVYV